MKKFNIYAMTALSLFAFTLTSNAQSTASTKPIPAVEESANSKEKTKEELKAEKKAAKTIMKKEAAAKRKAGVDYSTYANLGAIIRTKPGVQVTGAGDNLIVQIRGINSISLDTRPLYVIDGNIIGNDYARANSSMTTSEIGSVRIIKDLTQLTRYGEQGRNGVIQIKRKKEAVVKN